MTNKFTEVMAERTDTALIHILTIERDNYQAEAIVAAEAELAKRNLSPAQIDTANQINEEKKNQEAQVANEPLELTWKILAFIFPGGILLMTSSLFKIKGYERKAQEVFTWTKYGCLFYFTLIFLNIIRASF